MHAGPAPDTIVLVHGSQLTPLGWERWIAYYKAQGFRALAPAHPGLDLDGFVRFLRGLDTAPILIGHAEGGAFVQILLDRGFGACGVVLNSAPAEDVDFRNPRRAPLLFLSGGTDGLTPPEAHAADARRYTAPGTVTEHVTFPGRSHLMPVQDGWREVADFALAWATDPT
ncbi:hypothetical protein EDD29_3412 [Actinocorallia herbida]|uniref:Alpha/beta hydrolase family protein n=1 Tax=Actinocorallia herbida TaxID=58109 RepID=A0A3N1CX56_9ACTN|nr:alpha/beta hydrolase [Actinocorallia herbida]ROO85861.1 hypothetical protein EDD29_3412 [Actinocorallia herbida]